MARATHHIGLTDRVAYGRLVRIRRGSVCIYPKSIPDVYPTPVIEKSILIRILGRVSVIDRRLENSIGCGGSQGLPRVYDILQASIAADHSRRSCAGICRIRIVEHAPMI